MKLEKKYELQGKRLEKALKKIEKLQSELNIQEINNKKLTALVEELKASRKEHLDKINELQSEIDIVRKKREELDDMIKQVRLLKKEIK